jgi:hypothetical protein
MKQIDAEITTTGLRTTGLPISTRSTTTADIKARCSRYVFWNPKIPKIKIKLFLYHSYCHKTEFTIIPIQFSTKTEHNEHNIKDIMSARKNVDKFK